MKKNNKLKMLGFASVMMGAGLQLSAHANTQAPNTDIEKVLGELTRQHESASSLVKNARQPTSLALSSTLLSQPTVSKASNDDNVLSQLTAVASGTVSKFKQTGVTSLYGRQFHGRTTASGETFDMNAMTAAHSSLPMHCYIKVTNKDNGKSVVVKVNDRPQNGRMLSLSQGAAQVIGLTGGTGNVVIERVDNP